MRTYRLADSHKRKLIDLQDYAQIIESIVTSIVPDAVIIIDKEKYTIMSDISKGEVIRIGRALAHSSLGKYSISRPILFIGEEIENE